MNFIDFDRKSMEIMNFPSNPIENQGFSKENEESVGRGRQIDVGSSPVRLRLVKTLRVVAFAPKDGFLKEIDEFHRFRSKIHEKQDFSIKIDEKSLIFHRTHQISSISIENQ